MSNIKEYNNKLKSLKNTQKITKTMKMVSASKLRKAQDAQANAKLYAQSLTSLTNRIAASSNETNHPLFEIRKEVQKVLILIITSDKGLCGAFNHNANKRVALWIAENRSAHHAIDIACCGKRGYTFFKRREKVINHYDDVTINPDFADALRIGEELASFYVSGEYDEVYLTYNQFFSPLSQKTVFEKILPIDASTMIDQEDDEEKEKHGEAEYLFEPNTDQLLDYLVPHFLYFKIYFALLENSAGEHGARMTAMDNATKNASDLIDNYTLLRNRARQAAITTELTEIVAGAEAL